MLSACTIIARNYLAHARVLAGSFREQHPHGQFTVLIVDDELRAFDDSAEEFSCCRLADIGIDRAEIGRLAAIYDVTELSTAVKPLFLRHLLQASDHVLYLDPDTRVYAPLQTAALLVRQHSLVLTPHLTAPLPQDGRRIDEFHILSSGVYNLGFIGLGPRSEPFIDWWWQKTRRDALVDHNRMMFTDQRWIDFAPGFFEHCILKDPTYNVAYWNLHARDLVWNNDGYRIDGQPLTFFHFSGYDPRQPHLLSKHQADRPRILFSERPAVAKICAEYSERLTSAGLAAQARVPYGWSRLPSGIAFDVRMRRLYRTALLAHERGKGPEPPDPFDASLGDRFLEWLNEPVGAGLRPRASRYSMAVYRDRPDLQAAFPDLTGRDWSRYADWLRTDGRAQLNLPDALLPRKSVAAEIPPYLPAAQLAEGVNIAGYFRAELGIGEAARLLTSAVEAAGIPASTLTYSATASRKAHPFLERGEGRAPFDVNIICVNADRTPDFIGDAGRALLDGRYTIGVWFWELEYFPPAMHQGFDHVDEVWAATRFVTDAIRAIGRRPVHTVPLPVPIPSYPASVTRASLALPESFMFLFMFDFFSILERKNPIGVIQAFERAFRPGEGPVLVIKTINGEARLDDLERLRAAVRGRPDIRIVDEYYSSEEKNALLALCDCYVSLHRSEGFGLTMAEAMGLEKPVIATAYSGNLDFMTDENSYLVDYTRGSVPPGCDPYPEGSPWAEPNLDHAAELFRRVYFDRKDAARKAQQARHDILTRHSVAPTAAIVSRRLEEIRRSPAFAAARGRTAPAVGDPSMAKDPLFAMLDSLATQLTPEPQIAPGTPFRAARLSVQKLLFRLLRPYWWQQRQVQQSLIALVREASQLSLQAARTEPAQREALEAVWTAIHSLENGTNRLMTTLGQTAVAPEALEQRLYAPPFVADPDRLRLTDRQGRQILGYELDRDDVPDPGEFESLFRGPEDFIRDRQRVYVPLLARHQPVIDVGCGRGAMLDLLRDAGIEASGVDADRAMVARCRAKGHRVEEMDAVAFLKRQTDRSVGAIFSAQVVEHLTPDVFRAFLETSRAKLAAGGQLIFETINPHAIEAFKTFYTDLTRQRPIFPEVAVTLCRLAGFRRAHVFYPNGSGDPEQDRRLQGEYAVVATSSDPDKLRAR